MEDKGPNERILQSNKHPNISASATLLFEYLGTCFHSLCHVQLLQSEDAMCHCCWNHQNVRLSTTGLFLVAIGCVEHSLDQVQRLFHNSDSAYQTTCSILYAGKLKFSMSGGSSFSPDRTNWTPRLAGMRPARMEDCAKSLHRGESRCVGPLVHPRSQWLTKSLHPPEEPFRLMAKVWCAEPSRRMQWRFWELQAHSICVSIT